MPVSVELGEDDKSVIISAEYRYKELCTSIPGVQWKGHNIWKMPVSWAGCLALRSTFKDDLEIGPRLTEWATKELTTRITPANQLRELTELDVGDPDLYPHQRAGVAFLATARRALLADEPGLGKTAQAIRALAALTKQGENPFPALIVCPNTLKTNWEREFAKWWPGINVQVISGTPVQRRKQFEAFIDPKDDEPKPHVLVINWDALRHHSRQAPYGSISLARCPAHGGEDEKITATKCEVHPKELNMIDFKSVIADEMHRSKDPKSKQTRALWSASGDADIRYALTGTPMATDVLDYWSILHWLSPDEWPSKSRWTTRMVDMLINEYGGTLVTGVKSHMEAEFFASTNPRMRRMLKKIVLPNLPDVVNEQRTVEMSAKQKKAYTQMRDNMIAELEGGEYLTAPSTLTQAGRLLQFASAYATMETDPNTGESKPRLSEPSATIDAVISDLQSGDFGPDSIAISSVSRQLLELLSVRLTKAKIEHGMITGKVSPFERQVAIDDFQSGRTKVILFTAQAGGVGVTLTAARRLLRLQRPWSLVDDTQVNDRVHRIGSEIHDSIIITDYIVLDTVQQKVVEVLDTKGESFEAIVQDKKQLLNMLHNEEAKKRK